MNSTFIVLKKTMKVFFLFFTLSILYFLHSINKCEIALCTFNFVPFRRSNNQSSEIIDDKRR